VVHKGSGIECSVGSSVFSLLFTPSCSRPPPLPSSSIFFFFFLFFLSSPSLLLHRYRPIRPLGLCCGCLLWVLLSLTHASSLLIYRYTYTDTQILSVSSFVSSIRQLRIWQLILAPSWCSSTGDTFPSCHQSSVAFSLCRGLPLSSAPGDAVSRVIN